MSNWSWSWNSGTPAERAEMIRSHSNSSHRMTSDILCELFQLTQCGTDRILAGDNWRPEYQQTPEA